MTGDVCRAMTGDNGPVIVLDLDDTLYLERDFVRSGFAAVAAHVRESFGIGDFAARAAQLFNHGDRTRVFDALVTHYRLDAGLVPLLVDLYRAHVPDIALAPDAARWLQRHRHASRLAVITDGPERTQGNKLRALGLDSGGIAPLVCTGKWGRGWEKPNPRAFELVADHHRAAGENLVYVADNPAKDFIAPRALGWRTVQIKRPGAIHAGKPDCAGAVHADTVIRSFDELDGWLEVVGHHRMGNRVDVGQG
jgi:putative hydrolase of the HAD superfamily